MFEQVQRRILFDFEIISLLALMIGIVVYALLGSFRNGPKKGIGSQFEVMDLLLVCFPLIFFLINPVASYLAAGTGEASEPVDKSFLDQLFGVFLSIVSFLFTGVITLIILQWIMMRDVIDLFGLRRLEVWKIAVISIGGTVVSVIVCSLCLGHLSAEYLTNKFGELETQRAVAEMKSAESLPIAMLTVFVAVVVAPVIEELLFRGYFYGVLKRFSSPVFAALISSALFSVVHINLPALMPLWVFAIILIIAYEWTQCLWVPIGIHSMFNGFNVVMLFSEKVAEGV